MSTSLQQQVMQALARARITGQPVVIPGAQGLVATPQGGTRMATPMELQRANIPFFANQTSPFGPVPTAGPGVPAGTPSVMPSSALPGLMHVLSGPNMQVTNAPTGSTVVAPAGGASGSWTPAPAVPGGASGSWVPATAPVGPVPTAGPPVPVGTPADPASAARNYRLQHGLGTAQDRMTADQLNAMSLQAAQAGRTYWAPGTVVGPGQYAPNLLQAPPAAPVAANPLTNVHWLNTIAANQPPIGTTDTGAGG